MRILERLRWLFFYALNEMRQRKKKPQNEAKKGYDKKMIGEILIFEFVFSCEELI